MSIPIVSIWSFLQLRGTQDGATIPAGDIKFSPVIQVHVQFVWDIRFIYGSCTVKRTNPVQNELNQKGYKTSWVIQWNIPSVRQLRFWEHFVLLRVHYICRLYTNISLETDAWTHVILISEGQLHIDTALSSYCNPIPGSNIKFPRPPFFKPHPFLRPYMLIWT